jgi:predicted acylesterase/phospholipase RssA
VGGSSGELRIGVTISGAIALGAYDGGALAALLCAAQAVNERKPGALRIDAMAGASAGSITVLLAARTLLRGLDPIDAMYRAWVVTPQLDRISDGSVSPLSEERGRTEAKSLLGAEENLERAQSAPIRVNLALGCLRGLDYSIARIAGPPVSASTYLDWGEWTVEQSHDLSWYLASSGPVDTALASGAHPAGFPPYGLDRSDPAVLAGYEANKIQDFPKSNYLWYTDGGTIDNEPLGRTLDLTQDIDAAADDPLDAAARLHLLITPDPARPGGRDDAWSTVHPPPTWARTGLRTIKLVRQQRLYDDLRRVEKTNSRIEWVRVLERELLAIIRGERNDAEAALTNVAETITHQRHHLNDPEDFREDLPTGPDSPLDRALRRALDAATGFSKKRDVAVAVVSPLLLPEIVDGSTVAHDLLAGEFLGHFGGLMDERLRENDFALGYRSMIGWLGSQAGLAQQGLEPELCEVALAGAEASRDGWSRKSGRTWVQGLGRESFKSLPFRTRLKLYKVALRSAWIAFNQIRKQGA